MARLFRNQDGFKGGKYLVQRRDGTVPEWPYFVIGASDPAAPVALRAYALAAQGCGMDADYVNDIMRLADEFKEWRTKNTTGDPDAPRHREDDPEIIAKMMGNES
jgi:hypothetical protein